MESEAILVKKQIEEDFKGSTAQELENFFEQFRKDKRTLSFISYYNRTVLDKERIRFGEFKKQWAIQGMTKEIYTYFDENYDQLKGEIITKKDISSFFENYCTRDRREGSFCSKLFHTFFPSEFPPVDNPIRRRFNLKNEDFITSVLIIKKGYELFVKGNPKLINLIRKILSEDKFSFLRIDELSDIRILDMYFWFKLNRDKDRPRRQSASTLNKSSPFKTPHLSTRGTNDIRSLLTWAGKSKFSYSGSVAQGTTITYGSGFLITLSAFQYNALLNHFRGRTVDIGTSHDNPPRGSVGEWLQSHVTKTGIASYVGPILIAEGYAEKAGGPRIRFI